MVDSACRWEAGLRQGSVACVHGCMVQGSGDGTLVIHLCMYAHMLYTVAHGMVLILQAG